MQLIAGFLKRSGQTKNIDETVYFVSVGFNMSSLRNSIKADPCHALKTLKRVSQKKALLGAVSDKNLSDAMRIQAMLLHPIDFLLLCVRLFTST